nr:type II restriction endonuclease [Gluconobacter cerinus]
MTDLIRDLTLRWRDDPAGTYQSWFLWDERIKNFRSIRRGLQQVVAEIADGTFGVAYRGSSLETVVHSIAEQRQIFKGADHAFLWKPKLRIPDIYENPANQKAFGQLLDTCLCCNTEEHVVSAIHAIDARKIKGLGPAVANLLYFLHPTIMPPFNTAIVKGYNALTGSKVKLGRWEEYLAMRQGILKLNATYRSLLSNDLGAIGGLLFDLGSGRYTAPPLENDETARKLWEADLHQVREQSVKEARILAAERETDHTHTEIQGWLRDLGLSLGYDVWIAANDRSRPWQDGKLGDGCLSVGIARVHDGNAGSGIRAPDRCPVAGPGKPQDRCGIRGRAFNDHLFRHRADARSCSRVRGAGSGGPVPCGTRQAGSRCVGTVAATGVQKDCRSESSLSALWSAGEGA